MPPKLPAHPKTGGRNLPCLLFGQESPFRHPPQVRRTLYLPSSCRGPHRRAGSGSRPHCRGLRSAARCGGGHRHHPRPDSHHLRRPCGRHCRRCHQNRGCPHHAVHRVQAGRELPQDIAVHVQRCLRHLPQTLRPPAQHAHPRLHEGHQETGHLLRDTIPLHPSCPPSWPLLHQNRTRGVGDEIHQSRKIQRDCRPHQQNRRHRGPP